jgi:hypothetical protein
VNLGLPSDRRKDVLNASSFSHRASTSFSAPGNENRSGKSVCGPPNAGTHTQTTTVGMMRGRRQKRLGAAPPPLPSYATSTFHATDHTHAGCEGEGAPTATGYRGAGGRGCARRMQEQEVHVACSASTLPTHVTQPRRHTTLRRGPWWALYTHGSKKAW